MTRPRSKTKSRSKANYRSKSVGSRRKHNKKRGNEYKNGFSVEDCYKQRLEMNDLYTKLTVTSKKLLKTANEWVEILKIQLKLLGGKEPGQKALLMSKFREALSIKKELRQKIMHNFDILERICNSYNTSPKCRGIYPERSGRDIKMRCSTYVDHARGSFNFLTKDNMQMYRLSRLKVPK